jgi:metal-responsive CopG/Arc/MetJ family transcriptional regulator
MSRITITLPNDLIDELMSVVKAKNKTRAVIEAIRDEIRMKKRERIKSMAGKMEFVSSASELRHGDKRLG